MPSVREFTELFSDASLLAEEQLFARFQVLADEAVTAVKGLRRRSAVGRDAEWRAGFAAALAGMADRMVVESRVLVVQSLSAAWATMAASLQELLEDYDRLPGSGDVGGLMVEAGDEVAVAVRQVVSDVAGQITALAVRAALAGDDDVLDGLFAERDGRRLTVWGGMQSSLRAVVRWVLFRWVNRVRSGLAQEVLGA